MISTAVRNRYRQLQPSGHGRARGMPHSSSVQTHLDREPRIPSSGFAATVLRILHDCRGPELCRRQHRHQRHHCEVCHRNEFRFRRGVPIHRATAGWHCIDATLALEAADLTQHGDAVSSNSFQHCRWQRERFLPGKCSSFCVFSFCRLLLRSKDFFHLGEGKHGDGRGGA